MGTAAASALGSGFLVLDIAAASALGSGFLVFDIAAASALASLLRYCDFAVASVFFVSNIPLGLPWSLFACGSQLQSLVRQVSDFVEGYLLSLEIRTSHVCMAQLLVLVLQMFRTVDSMLLIVLVLRTSHNDGMVVMLWALDTVQAGTGDTFDTVQVGTGDILEFVVADSSNRLGSEPVRLLVLLIPGQVPGLSENVEQKYKIRILHTE